LTDAQIDQIMAAQGTTPTEPTVPNPGELEQLRAQIAQLTQTNQSAQAMIKQLRGTKPAPPKPQGQREPQTPPTPETAEDSSADLERQLAEAQAELAKIRTDSALKVAMLSAKAKPDDIDYLIFRLRQQTPDIALGDDGKVKGVDDLIKAQKATLPKHFEDDADAGKDGLKPIGNPLPKDKGTGNPGEPKTMTEAIRMEMTGGKPTTS
jgi:hypothetical protein